MSRQKVDSHLLMAINKQNNRHKTPPQTHIAFVMPRFKGIVSLHKSGVGNNQGRQQTIPCDNRCFNRNDCHSNINKLLLPMISVSPSFNNSVINASQLSLVRPQSSSSSHNTPRDNQCFNSKDSNSKSNYFSSPVILVPPPLNDSVINTTHLSSVCQQSPRSSYNTTHKLQAYSIPGRNSPDPSNTMPPPSSKNTRLTVSVCVLMP